MICRIGNGHKGFRHTLMIGTMLVGSCGWVVPAFAQAASSGPSAQVAGAGKDDASGPDIIVSGLRADLDNAVERKRETLGVADFLPVADVGSLVTTDIAEALEFTPGIVGLRFRGSVETISLRGLPQLLTLSTINGRVLSGRNGDRSVFFLMYPSELFTTAAVYKSTSAELTEGGIAGTVSLETPSPLSMRSGMTFQTRALVSPYRKNYTLGADKVGGKINFLGSQKFELGSGELGVAFGFNYLSDPTTTGQALAVGFSQATVAGTATVLPNSVTFSGEGETFKRASLIGVVEYANDNGFHLKMDTIISSSENTNLRDIIQVNNLNIPARYTSAVFNGDNLQSAQMNGLAFLNRIENIYVNTRAEMYGLNMSQDFDGWKISLDSYLSRTTNDQLVERPILQVTGVNALMTLQNDFIGFSNLSKDLTNTANYGAFQNFAQKRHVYDRVWGTRLQVDRKFDGVLRQISLGGAFTRREIDSLLNAVTNTDVRNATLYPNLAVGRLPSSLFLSSPHLNFSMPGTAGTYPVPFAVIDRFKLAAMLPPITDFPITDTVRLTGQVDNREDTWAGFVKSDFEAGGLRGSVGVRLVNTRLTANGFTGNLVPVTINGVTRIVVNGLTPAVETNEYTYLLPSATMSYELRPGLIGRLAAGRALSRAEFNDLRMAQNLLGGDESQQPFFGSSGNPQLNPIISDQADVALEWYPRRGTSVSVSGYFKHVKGFVTTQVVAKEIAGFDYQISQPVNTNSGNFYGIEAQVRYDFDFLPDPLNGLGIIANGSRNWTTIDPGYGILNVVDASGQFQYDAADRNPGVVGFTPWTASGILFYEKGPLALRFSARYASDRVRSVSSLNAPIVSVGRTYLDASASFRLNRNVTLQFQAVNLTETADSGYFVYRNYTAWNQQTGRSYFFGVDFKM